MPNTKIVSLGHYVPPKVVTNKDLEEVLDTTDEWIVQRSGIKERRWIEPGDSTINMATEASKEALQKANLKADDIDAILFGCLIGDHIFPGSGVLLQQSLGMSKTIPAMDIRNQCSFFVYAMSVADAWIKSGMYKRILIVGSEVHSTSLDLTPRGRDVSVLFGDGAGACIVEATEEEGVIAHHLASEGQYHDKLWVKSPSSGDFPRIQMEGATYDDMIYAKMAGRFVFKHAVSRMTESLSNLLKENHLTADDIDFVIAHQANMRINQMVLEQLKIPLEKTHHSLDHYGNTTAATIPLTMYEAVEKGLLKRGSLVAFVAFGAGFTWGSTLLKY